MSILWLKALHVSFMVAWFAGIFYLPRLFAYHSSASDQISKDRFILMEGKLLRVIMMPSAIVTILLGFAMLAYYWEAYASATWLHLKLLLVFCLIIYHGFCIHYAKQFALNQNSKSERFFRLFNEIPVPILIGIVIMVVVRPFS